jgi:hypothetical protein
MRSAICPKTQSPVRQEGVHDQVDNLAFNTVSGPDLSSYCESFVRTFGSLQENPDQKMLTDENYRNRHAIAHGLMQRAMGIKDSAKRLMAIKFLFIARKEEEKDEAAQETPPDQNPQDE